MDGILGFTPLQLIIGASALVAALLSVVVIGRLMRRQCPVAAEPRLTPVDVASLSNAPPALSRTHCEVYNVPVRVSAIVVAPVGRDRTVPNDFASLLDEACPGLEEVIELDRPSIVSWPPQLSTQGFTRSFFANATLPGDQGKGTPWCSVAGRIESASGSLLAGIIFRAAAPNNLGQFSVERSTQWLDTIRVRRQESDPDF